VIDWDHRKSEIKYWKLYYSRTQVIIGALAGFNLRVYGFRRYGNIKMKFN